MNVNRLPAAILAAGALAAPATAVADAPITGTPATDGFLLATVNAADHALDVDYHVRPACGQAIVLMYDNPTGEALGEINGCRVWFDNGWLTTVRGQLAHAHRHAQIRIRATSCAFAAHERGHNYGWTHTGEPGNPGPASLMLAGDQRDTPPACLQWARDDTDRYLAPVLARRALRAAHRRALRAKHRAHRHHRRTR